ncbi:MAG: tetratricopeptide repeat protein [Planctomycetaceae bacterium]
MSDQPTTADRPQSSLPLAGERVTFTGTLASMTHREGYEVIQKFGGIPVQHVSRQLTLLVIGEEGWPLEDDGHPSVKLQQALQKQTEGIELRIINESTWLKWLGLDEREREVHRWYTPAMLSKLLDVPVSAIRRWARIGLIHPVRKVMKLPYFDFREVSSARRLAELIGSNIPQQEIEQSLQHLSNILPEIDRPLSQLQILARHHRLLYRDDEGLIEARTGQRLLDFTPPDTEEPRNEPAKTLPFHEAADVAPGIAVQETSSSNAHQLRAYRTDDDVTPTEFDRENAGGFDGDFVDDGYTGENPDAESIPVKPEHIQRSWEEWYDAGCLALEKHDAAAAIEAFRMSLMDEPGHPEVNFHLAEALYRSGNLQGALERYHVAVEADHQYIEAWTQLGCLLAELFEPELAIKAFQIALEYHAEYPDAHYHLAELLYKQGKASEAVTHWQTYLQFDQRGPWAEIALQRLEVWEREEP